MRFTWWPGTRAGLRLWPKGAARAPSQAGRRAGTRHAGEGQAADPRPDPTWRPGGSAHAGQRAADHDQADHPGLFNALSERDGADSAVKDVFSLSEGKPV